MNVLRHLLAAIAAGLLGACATGSGPARNLPEAPAAFTPAQGATGMPMRLDWWTRFGDPVLDALVESALDQNRELAVASANLRAAGALAAEAGANRGPTGEWAGSRQQVRQSALSQPPVEGTPDQFATQTIADTGLTLAWEIDLFGALAASETAASAETAATRWLRRQAEAAVAAATVRAYVDLQSASALEELARDRIAGLASIVERLRRAEELGAVPRDRVDEAQGALEGLHAELPLLALHARNAARRIAVLTGRPPQHGAQSLTDWVRSPLHSPETLDAGDPMLLLRQRPDVGAAEQRLRAAVARIDVATAALYPRITLVGEGGVSAEPGSLDADGALRFAAGPTLTWGVFDLARTRARIAATEADAEAALAQWEHTVLIALEEADAAIDGWASARAAAAAASRSAAAAQRAAEAARVRVERGLASPIDLTRTEIARLVAESAASQAEAAATQAWVQAHLALGAGWRDAGGGDTAIAAGK
jgi:NodT family efflux transporter outer membrane factor (OMF) lipoprotein